MRHVISVDWKALGESVNDMQSSRTVIPDAETLVHQYVSAAMQLDDLEQTFDRWLARPAVAIAEDSLAREFHSNWRQQRGTLDRWDSEVKKQAALLSKAATLS